MSRPGRPVCSNENVQEYSDCALRYHNLILYSPSVSVRPARHRQSQCSNAARTVVMMLCSYVAVVHFRLVQSTNCDVGFTHLMEYTNDTDDSCLEIQHTI